MFRKLLLVISLFSSLISIDGYLTDNSQLRKQYNNFIKFAGKTGSESSFEIFVETLNKIEVYNQENSNCKMYLTQHSDTLEPNAVFRKCFI